MKYLTIRLLALLWISAICTGSLYAADAGGAALHALPAALENQEMRIITINLVPGQESSPHRHNAHVFVTVLEGNIEMQVRGGPLTRLGPGDSFYESPDDIHQVSRNMSSTEPAKFIVHMLKTVGQAATAAVN